MLNSMSNFVTRYLNRINYQGTLEPQTQTLQDLQFAHLLSIPFENLSIHLQQPIELNDLSLAKKIIEQHRGGFCYELNGLFATLLKALGFQVTLLSAQVARENETFGRELGHLTLLVKTSESWLVDVGFGDSFIYPLKLKDSVEQIQQNKRYKLIDHFGHWTLYQYDDRWKPQYCFNLTPRKLTDFEPMCLYNQTHSQSIFKQRLICTIATQNGRFTLSDRKFIITQSQQKTETLIETEVEYKKHLKKIFQIDLNDYPIEKSDHLFQFLFSK